MTNSLPVAPTHSKICIDKIVFTTQPLTPTGLA